MSAIQAILTGLGGLALVCGVLLTIKAIRHEENSHWPYLKDDLEAEDKRQKSR